MECCRDGCPSERFSHLQRGILELCQSDHRVLGNIPDLGPSPLIAQCGRAASCRKSLRGAKPLTFKKDGGHCVLGDLQCCRHFLAPFPRSVSRYNPVSDLYGQFLRTHCLVFALTCTVNWGTLNRQACACPINWLYHTWPPIISRLITRNSLDLSSILSLIVKRLNTYVKNNGCFLIHFPKHSKNLFLLCHYGVLCVDWWGTCLI